MTSEVSELLPCPFCGEDNAMLLGPTCSLETPYDPTDRLFPIVRCGSCCAEVSGDNEDYRGKSAIAAWNRRAKARQEPGGDAGQWFDLTGDARLGVCATDGCGGQPVKRLEAGGVGANYCSGCAAKIQSMQEPPRPAAVTEEGWPGKYGDVLTPFIQMMETELHANSGKGDRLGWLAMSREALLLEIYYHLAKLQKATLKNDDGGIREFGADVANMSMMLVDKCGVLCPTSETEAARPAETVAIKPLEWSIDAFTSTLWANSPFGRYEVWEISGNAFWHFAGGPSVKAGYSKESAKAAAAADYKQRIRSALLSTPHPAGEAAYWSVWSATGEHLGTWPDEADARKALAGYEAPIPRMRGTIKPLYPAPQPVPGVVEALRDVLAAIGDWARPTGANGMIPAGKDHPLVVSARKARAALASIDEVKG